jgi:hypothetical protein
MSREHEHDICLQVRTVASIATDATFDRGLLWKLEDLLDRISEPLGWHSQLSFKTLFQSDLIYKDLVCTWQ